VDAPRGPRGSYGPGGPVLLVVSPQAGHAATAPDAALRSVGLTVADVLPVSALDRNLPQGARWRERGIAAVVAAGGDGTLGAVATQVAGSGLPMGILPLGTSNDSARSLGIPIDCDEAARVIAEGVPTDVDVGQVVPALTEPRALSPEATPAPAPTAAGSRADLATHGAYFLHALTLGLNVEFARLATDVAHRARWGNLTYAASAVEALTHFEAVPVTLRLAGVHHNGAAPRIGGLPTPDELVISSRALQVAVVNLPVFGGALNFIIIEALDPRLLRDTIEKLVAALHRLRESFFAASAHGTPHADVSDESVGLALPGVHRFQAREAVVETPAGVDVTLDGEIRARTPVQVRVAPKPVRVLLRAGLQPAQAAEPSGNDE
jgi:diacylglycerol kinase (ATP)